MFEFAAICLTLVLLDESTAKRQAPKLATQPIAIVDPDGKPIEGASAKSVVFNEKFYVGIDGLDRSAKSNKEGICELLYPDILGIPIESATPTCSSYRRDV